MFYVSNKFLIRWDFPVVEINKTILECLLFIIRVEPPLRTWTYGRLRNTKPLKFKLENRNNITVQKWD